MFNRRRSFLDGIASLFTFRLSLERYGLDRDPVEIDREAIASDWAAVGNDMRVAIEVFEVQHDLRRRHTGNERTTPRNDPPHRQ
jgi:hypothetical protein